MTIKDKWIKACEITLNEYKNNTHHLTVVDCTLCSIANKFKNDDKNKLTKCIFGTCIPHLHKCNKMFTFPKGTDTTQIQVRIRFYEMLIPILKSRNNKDFHIKNLHKITKICNELDEVIWKTHQNKSK